MTKKNRKKLVGITTGLAALLMTTGTFAWTSISQQVLNDKEGRTEAGGRIHDDYNRETGNKDIYAENYSTQNLLVRVKLTEYMDNNGTPLIKGTDKANKKTWPRISQKTEEYRKYVTWTLGGNNKEFLPTFNTNNTSLETDAAGDAKDEITGGPTALGDGSEDFFTNGEEITNPNDLTIKHKVKSTLTEEQRPIMLEKWKTLPKSEQIGNYWVIDSSDGWAYWADTVAPGESTSLLLTQLHWNNEAIGDLDNWYYGMDVIGEFSTKSDVSELSKSEYGAPSADAELLLNNISKGQFSANVGDIIEFNNESFVYLKDLGDGNRLIIKDEVLNNCRPSTSPVYNGGELDLVLQDYYKQLSAAAKSEVQPIQKSFDIGEPGISKTYGLDEAGFIASNPRPDRAVYTPNGVKKAFALSMDEVSDVSGKGKAFINLNSRAKGTDMGWWLRSAHSSERAYFVSGSEQLNPGKIHNASFTSEGYRHNVRPALIINRK